MNRSNSIASSSRRKSLDKDQGRSWRPFSIPESFGLRGFPRASRFARRNLVAFAPGFGDAYSDRLLAALYLAASAGLEIAMLELVHHLGDFFLRLRSVLAARTALAAAAGRAAFLSRRAALLRS